MILTNIESFRDFLEVNEALTIVKKAKIVTDDDTIIGKIKDYEIIKTTHASDERKNVKRDVDLSNNDIISIIQKSLYKLKPGYNAVLYKNGNEKYDSIIVHKEQNTLRVVTIIQQNREKPNYYIKSSDNKIIQENAELNLILLD